MITKTKKKLKWKKLWASSDMHEISQKACHMINNVISQAQDDILSIHILKFNFPRLLFLTLGCLTFVVDKKVFSLFSTECIFLQLLNFFIWSTEDVIVNTMLSVCFVFICLYLFFILVGYETICISNYVEQLSVKTGKKAKDKVFYFALLFFYYLFYIIILANTVRV